jgi:hypothetical protein
VTDASTLDNTGVVFKVVGWRAGKTVAGKWAVASAARGVTSLANASIEVSVVAILTASVLGMTCVSIVAYIKKIAKLALCAICANGYALEAYTRARQT